MLSAHAHACSVPPVERSGRAIKRHVKQLEPTHVYRNHTVYLYVQAVYTRILHGVGYHEVACTQAVPFTYVNSAACKACLLSWRENRFDENQCRLLLRLHLHAASFTWETRCTLIGLLMRVGLLKKYIAYSPVELLCHFFLGTSLSDLSSFSKQDGKRGTGLPRRRSHRHVYFT